MLSITAVTPATVNPGTASTATAPSPQPSSSHSSADTVHISAGARAALQEASETSTQTAQEAQKGDQQAKRLLVREAAEKADGL